METAGYEKNKLILFLSAIYYIIISSDYLFSSSINKLFK